MFIHFNSNIYNTNTISSVDCSRYVEEGFIMVHFLYRVERVAGPEAMNVIMALCPAVLEGKRGEYPRHAWAVHNLIGHPLMQVFSWLHLTSFGIKIHDATVPEPLVKYGV